MAEKDTAPAPAPEAPHTDNSGIVNLPSGEEPTTPIEVELGDLPADVVVEGEDTPPAAADAAPAAPKPKKRADNRVQVATNRAVQAETTAERYRREAEELRAQSQTTRQQYEGASTAAMQHYKKASELEVQLAQRNLKDAIDAGDSTAQAEAQAKMSEAQAALNDVKNWEAQQAAAKKAAPPAAAPQERPDQRPPAQQAQVEMHPDTQAWVSANPWFEPGNPDFDPKMHNAAARYGGLLETEYEQEGRSAEVGSAEYFARIDDYMRTRFPDSYADDDGGEPPVPATPAPRPRTPPMARRQEPVAASTRTLANGAIVKTLGNGKRSITLDAEQRTFARNLWKNGSMSIIDPQTKQARPVKTEQEAYQAFGMQLVADAQRQAQKGNR